MQSTIENNEQQSNMLNLEQNQKKLRNDLVRFITTLAQTSGLNLLDLSDALKTEHANSLIKGPQEIVYQNIDEILAQPTEPSRNCTPYSNQI